MRARVPLNSASDEKEGPRRGTKITSLGERIDSTATRGKERELSGDAKAARGEKREREREGEKCVRIGNEARFFGSDPPSNMSTSGLSYKVSSHAADLHGPFGVGSDVGGGGREQPNDAMADGAGAAGERRARSRSQLNRPVNRKLRDKRRLTQFNFSTPFLDLRDVVKTIQERRGSCTTGGGDSDNGARAEEHPSVLPAAEEVSLRQELEANLVSANRLLQSFTRSRNDEAQQQQQQSQGGSSPGPADDGAYRDEEEDTDDWGSEIGAEDIILKWVQ